MKIADEFNEAVDVLPPKPIVRYVQETIVRLYTASVDAFGDVVAKINTLPEHGKSFVEDPKKREEELAAWFNGPNLSDEDNNRARSKSVIDRSVKQPAVTPLNTALYMCSFCGCPSAILKKCLFLRPFS
jgi:hypothetical protein